MSDHPENAKKNISTSILFPRVLWQVIRAAGLVQSTIVFLVLYCVSSLAVSWAEPQVGQLPDAFWLMFQVVTTIGLGDFTCNTLVGRTATIVLSLYSVFFLALLTGAVVSYCTESIRAKRDESIAEFVDQLEHLPDLSHDELALISEKVKNFEKKVPR